MNIIEFFIGLSNTVKLYHWKTGSYARHKASDELFEFIIESSDKFVEVYLGKYGRSIIKSIDCKIEVLSDDEIVKYLEKSIVYLNDMVKSKQIKASDSDLLNIRDEIVAKINQTLYLFTFK